MITAQERTDSLLTLTRPTAMSSSLALMVNTSRTNVLEDSTSMNTLELVFGQKMQTARDVPKKRRKPKTDSPAPKKRPRMTKPAKSSLIHITHTPKIARSSTFASTELNQENWDVQLEKFSTTKQNVAMLPKMFPDGKFNNVQVNFEDLNNFFPFTAKTGSKKPPTKTNFLSNNFHAFFISTAAFTLSCKTFTFLSF